MSILIESRGMSLVFLYGDGKMKSKKLLIILVFITAIAIGAVMLLKDDMVSNTEFNKVVKTTSTGFVYEPKDKVEVRDEYKIYDDMHKMANTKIVADAVWGRLDMEEERINKLIIEVLNSEYDDKEKLISILKNWKSGDFTHCVEEHNYFWAKLDGSIGQATALK